MKVFVTGASGFIGRAFVDEAVRRGHDLLCLARSGTRWRDDRVSVARGDLASIPWNDVERFAPDALLHLAWIATPGEYLHSPLNQTFLDDSRMLVDGLAARGVTRFVAAGSGIEYAPSEAPLVEATSPTLGDSAYAAAKCRLQEWLSERDGAARASWSWLRVFYPFGPGEHAGRITTAFLQRLAAGETLVLRTPDSVKDFIFVTDLARAVCDVLQSNVVGPVNLGTGIGTSIRNVALSCAAALGRDEALVRAADVLDVDPRPVVVADVTRLHALGWRPEVPIDEGVSRLARALGLTGGRPT